jgi:ATP-binding cassette, subfamily C (CFTR/MRP), member 1
LFKSILSAFWNDFLLLVILNIVSTVMGLCGPLIIKKLIDFIKTGKNPYDY